MAGGLYHVGVRSFNEGRYAEAEPLYERALAIWEAALGPENADVGTSLNGLAALVLAVRASIGVWALYTGFLSYLFMGTLFALEFLYRTWRFRRYTGGFLNPLLERLFPPRPGE